jgi:hypothetical protein
MSMLAGRSLLGAVSPPLSPPGVLHAIPQHPNKELMPLRLA